MPGSCAKNSRACGYVSADGARGMYCPLRKQEFLEIYCQSLEHKPPRVQKSSALGSDAAVGFICAEDSIGDLYFLLTLRSDKLVAHPGEVCLPGGHVEIEDEGN